MVTIEKRILVIDYTEEEIKNKVIELVKDGSDLYLRTDNKMWVHLVYQEKYEMLQITVLNRGHLECCGFIDKLDAIKLFNTEGYFESKHIRIEFIETGELLLTFK